MKLVIAVFAAVWPIMFNTLYGVHDVDPYQKDMGRSFGLGRFAIIRRIVIPAAAPFIMTGVRIASSISLIVVITVELISPGGALGIGAFIAAQQVAYYDPTTVYLAVFGATITAGVVGLGINLLIGWVERRWFGWDADREGRRLMTELSTRVLATRALRASADRPRWHRVLVSIAYFVIPLVAAIALWQLASTLAKNPFFPPPLAIIANLWKLLFGSEKAVQDVFVGEFLATVGRMALGFAIGAAWGVVVGTIMGLWRGAREVVTPIVEFLRSIPATATLPAVHPAARGRRRHARRVHRLRRLVVRAHQHVGRRRLDPQDAARRREGVPRLAPSAALRDHPARRAAEDLRRPADREHGGAAARDRLRVHARAQRDRVSLIVAQSKFALLNMWSWMLALAILGLIINSLLELIERRVLSWHRLSRQKV